MSTESKGRMVSLSGGVNVGSGVHIVDAKNLRPVNLSPGLVQVREQHAANEPPPLIVGCAVSCYGKAPAEKYTREAFRIDTRFDDLFESAPPVITLSELDCIDSPTASADRGLLYQNQRYADTESAALSDRQRARAQVRIHRSCLLANLSPERVLKIIADQIGGPEQLATTEMDILLDHEFSHAWTSSAHAECYRWFMAQIRHACPRARIDQYGSIARDYVRFLNPARTSELEMMDSAAEDGRLGVGGGCFPHHYVAYPVGTQLQRLADRSIQSFDDFRKVIVSNLGRYERVAARRGVQPMRPGILGGRVLVISPWVGDQWDVKEDGLTDFTAARRVGKQALYEIVLAAWRRGWRVMVWSACTNARQAEDVAKALQEDLLPAVQAVRRGKRPDWAWAE